MSQEKKSISAGLIWSVLEKFVVTGTQLLFSIIIARQLSPDDYGIIAMFSVFISISQCLIDAGFTDALIQKQDRSESDYATVFYFNVLVAVILYVVLFVLAPNIARFYNQPILEQVTRISGVVLIIQALYSIQIARIQIYRTFKTQTIISFISAIISGVIAIVLVRRGLGIWTLVFQTIINYTVNCIGLWVAGKWRPVVFFSVGSFKELFGFGYKIMIGGLIHYIYTNLYTLIIGKFYKSSDLGYFNRANSLSQMPSISISTVLIRVFYPAECELQDDDDALTEAYFRYLRVCFFVISPLMLGLCAVSDTLIRVLLTEKWVGCVLYLQILCFAYMWEPAMMLTWSLLNAKHRSDLSLKSEIFKKVAAFILLIISAPLGVTALCFSLVAYSLIDILIVSLFTRRLLPRVTFWGIIRNIFPILSASALMALFVYLIHFISINGVIKLSLSILSGVLIYYVLCRVFGISELQLIISKIKRHD